MSNIKREEKVMAALEVEYYETDQHYIQMYGSELHVMAMLLGTMRADERFRDVMIRVVDAYISISKKN